MNRPHPNLHTSDARVVLEPEALAQWSVEDFAFARRVARAPMAISGGLASARIALDLALSGMSQPVVALPLRVGGSETLTLQASGAALDALAGLLEPGKPVAGAGRTLSLDAIEALFSALLAPLTTLTLGDAHWSSEAGEHPCLCALHLDGQAFPLSGSHASLVAFQTAFAQKVDRLVAAPLSFLKDTQRKTPALAVELVLGAVALDAADLARLETQGAVLLDSHWAQGKTMATRRFTAPSMSDTWSLASDISTDTLLVRSAHDIVAFDADRLAATPSPDQPLELVAGNSVLAHGSLVPLTHQGEARIAFVISELFS